MKTPGAGSRARLGEGPDKARFVSEMFSRIAQRYDLMNGLMTLGMHHAWRRVAAHQTLAAPEGPALDLATGTGDLALELRRIHPNRLIVGADFALGMLDVAREKLARTDREGRIRLAGADALHLPFGDRTFACVTSAFLLRNLADLERGVCEMRRVTRPGGRVVALEITQPQVPGFSPLFRFYFHRIVPRIGQFVGSDREAYTYLPQSVDRFLTPSELSRFMEGAGLRSVTFQLLGMHTVTVHTGIA
jgi:demethylmenaquinone methyltransferase / 2-methoxy-6-polyprenyl-1,4-benzoquinol methylase